MSFQLLEELDLPTNYYVFSRVRVLAIPENLQGEAQIPDLLRELMASSFHLWQGEEYPDGFSTNWTWERDGQKVNEELHNVKVFGHYELDKLDPGDYRRLSKAEMDEIFKSFVEKHTFGDEEYLKELQDAVNKRIASDDAVFFLDLSPEKHPEKLSEVLNNYSFFLCFFSVSFSNNTLVMVEFGRED